MKWIKYKILCNEHEEILLEKKVGYNEANLAIAESEAYEGKYTIEEDDMVHEKEPLAVEFGGTGANSPASALTNLGAMGFMKRVTSDDDLNDLVTPGVYYYYTDSIPANCPYENAGIVEVIATGRADLRVLQKVTRYGVNDCTSQRLLNQEGKWLSWKRFVLVDVDSKIPISDIEAYNEISTLGRRTVIPPNSNFNTYVTPGVYCVGGNIDAEKMTNCPSNLAGELIVKFVIAPKGVTWGAEYVAQTYKTLTGITYERYSTDNGASWRDWNIVFSSQNMQALFNRVAPSDIGAAASSHTHPATKGSSNDIYYYKTADGLLIQWGSTECGTEDDIIDITLPQSYSSGSSFVVMVTNYVRPGYEAGGYTVNKSMIRICRPKGGNTISWMTIGY